MGANGFPALPLEGTLCTSPVTNMADLELRYSANYLSLSAGDCFHDQPHDQPHAAGHFNCSDPSAALPCRSPAADHARARTIIHVPTLWHQKVPAAGGLQVFRLGL